LFWHGSLHSGSAAASNDNDRFVHFR
jgi:hypothetical protein